MSQSTAPQFSCADFTFPLLAHDKVLALVRLLDFEAVDIGLLAERSHIQPKDVAANPAAAGAQLLARLQANGLHASDVFLQTGADPGLESPNDPDPAVRRRTREVFERVLEYCVAVGSRHMTGLPGVRHPESSERESLDLAAEEASWRAETAGRAGVSYAVEAHVGSVCPDPPSVLRFLERAKGVTLTLDYGHFIAEGLANEAVHSLLPFASHFHARGGCLGKLQVSVKENTIDFEAIVSGLRNNSYNGYICLEYVWADWQECNRTDNLSETILLREHLRNLSTGM